MISQLIHNIALASVCSTIFAFVLILTRNITAKLIGANWNYCLWISIFIPWIAVWLPSSFLPDLSTAVNLQNLTNALQIQQEIQDMPIETGNFLQKIIIMVWLFGFIAVSIIILIKHFKFVSLLKEKSKPLTIEQEKIVKNFLPNKNLISFKRIFSSTIISSPIICHIIKSKIYLPENFFKDYTQEEQKYVLQHECVHYQRCDLIANTGMLILICLNWFNPIILISYRYFRCAQELSCDATLSQQLSFTERKAYGYALLKSSCNGSSEVSSMSCWWNNENQLKERCKMLKLHSAKPLKNLLGIFTLTAITTVALAMPNLNKNDRTLDLKISNSSKNPLTFSIGYHCSKEIGIIDGNSVKTISQNNVYKACGDNLNHCELQGYETTNCSGKPIVSLVLDMSRGVMSIQPLSRLYRVGGNRFNIFFDGPWSETDAQLKW